MTTPSKHDQFAAIADDFIGRRGLLVEFGPTIEPVEVIDVTCDAAGMRARVSREDGSAHELSARWEAFVFDPDFWQITYANARVVFDREAVRLHDAGEPFEIDDYL